MSSQFELNTDNVLGFDYQAYLSNIRALALSKPDVYFEMRASVLEVVRRNAVKDLYRNLFHVLKYGRSPPPVGTAGEGNALVGVGTLFGQDKKYRPGFPENKINDFCIQVAQELGDHINRAIDIILPDEFEKLAAGKLELKGRGNTITVAP
jgi:hypothetical protein